MKDCNQCGKCCIKYGGGDLYASQDEIELWEVFNPDIFEHVKNNKIWYDPRTGEKLETCPFLKIEPKKSPQEQNLYTCSIYLNRPEDCRDYPSLVSEMIHDECEMIEVIDITNTEQAQLKLSSRIK